MRKILATAVLAMSLATSAHAGETCDELDSIFSDIVPGTRIDEVTIVISGECRDNRAVMRYLIEDGLISDVLRSEPEASDKAITELVCNKSVFKSLSNLGITMQGEYYAMDGTLLAIAICPVTTI